ncbi:MAG: hypothetical protein KJ587_18940 [Alphaproteobacteria bacterium]|nr:hypothetical protein [Alphaproteobacteria bacterium]
MTNKPQHPELTRLREVLEIYGADRSRWPAVDRLSLGRINANSEEARQLLAEYRSLDRLLDAAARREEIAVLALTQRIFAAAERDRAAQRETASASTSLPRPTVRRLPVRSRFQIAALAAAVTLVFGIGLLAGLSGIVAPDLQEIASTDDTIDIDDPLLDEDVI